MTASVAPRSAWWPRSGRSRRPGPRPRSRRSAACRGKDGERCRPARSRALRPRKDPEVAEVPAVKWVSSSTQMLCPVPRPPRGRHRRPLVSDGPHETGRVAGALGCHLARCRPSRSPSPPETRRGCRHCPGLKASGEDLPSRMRWGPLPCSSSSGDRRDVADPARTREEPARGAPARPRSSGSERRSSASGPFDVAVAAGTSRSMERGTPPSPARLPASRAYSCSPRTRTSGPPPGRRSCTPPSCR